ncbi:uncharacterized protein G2W53_040920 [Senna tora]|uniref:Uncharacterized protein n=1 Tax=Senna tora TaxID=362788 RepID=A0A834SR23_9FABA|nr:uncharacterized protein G2W53_040920 [Senna tora]
MRTPMRSLVGCGDLGVTSIYSLCGIEDVGAPRSDNEEGHAPRPPS